MRLRLLVEFELSDFVQFPKKIIQEKQVLQVPQDKIYPLVSNGKSVECKVCGCPLPIGDGVKRFAGDTGFYCTNCWQKEKK